MNIIIKILILEIIYLFINIFIILKNISIIIIITNLKFRLLNNDIFSYKKISDFINSKYYIKIFNSNEPKNKKPIKLFFIDSARSLNGVTIIKKILSQKFQIIIDEKNPDFLIYNVYGCKHLEKKYINSIKIAYYTENQIPDFNIADYAVGQAHISFLDRYLRLPYLSILNKKRFNNTKLNLIRRYALKHPRKKFCAAIISNSENFTKFRKNFINILNKYKKVDMGGRYNNNVGKIKNKILFLSNYKFSIAMENSEGDGYLSEKIIDSFEAGTIPIYYGDYMLDEFINPNSYILIRGEKDLYEKIRFIKKIDNDDSLYKKILKENVFSDLNFVEKMKNRRDEFLIHIFMQNKTIAKRIDNYYL